MHYLYRITNQINQKIYIGQTVNPRKRWIEHKSFAVKKPKSQVISSAIAKHGHNNFVFEIIAECITQDDANYTEIELIKQYNCLANDGYGYNVKLGGHTPNPVGHRGHAKKTLSTEQEQQIVELYQSGLSCTQIERQLNLSVTLVWRTLKRANVSFRKPSDYHNPKTVKGHTPFNKGKYKLTESDIALVKTMTYQQAHDKFGLSPKTVSRYKKL